MKSEKPQLFGLFIAKDIAQYTSIAKKANIKLEE